VLRDIRTRLLAILALLAGGATLVTLSVGDKAQLRTDLQAVIAIASDPEHEQYATAQSLLPTIEKICPTCALPAKTHCQLRAEPDYYCRDGLKYGPGLGGVDRRGAPVLCACTVLDRRTEKMIVAGEESRDPEKTSDEELIEIIKERLR
jgi:hypothetical protein